MYHVSRESFLYLSEFYIGEIEPQDRPLVPMPEVRFASSVLRLSLNNLYQSRTGTFPHFGMHYRLGLHHSMFAPRAPVRDRTTDAPAVASGCDHILGSP